MKIAIIIPARYGSTRFPGKPLAMLGEQAMIDHVYRCAQKAIHNIPNCTVMVATDDDRIMDHCNGQGYACFMTSEDCRTGTDRVLEAAVKLSDEPDIVVNLQGDAPLTPIEAVTSVIQCFHAQPDTQIATPVKQLTWDELDALRVKKKNNPFSGTSVVFNDKRRALWFSKQIIPAIRKEDTMRADTDSLSPVYQHLGLYAYRLDVLRRAVNLPQGRLETLEGLEQLRFLENDIPVTCVELSPETLIHGGVDSPDDLKSAQAFLERESS